MKEKNNIKKYIVYFIIAFISFISISAIATILDKIYSIKKFNIIYVFLFIFNCIYTKKYIKFNNYLTNKILFSIYGFIFCIFYFMGLVLNNDLLLSKKIILLIILASLGTYMPISFFVINADIKLKQVLISNKKNEKLTSIKKCLIGIIIFLSWFLVFLAYYPGLFNYDVVNQLEQGYGNYSTHHPLIHTLLINFFYNLSDNRNLGIVLYTIIQMSILALAFTYEMIFLYKINRGH